MYLPASFWKAVAVVTSYLTLSPLHPDDAQQPIAVHPVAEICTPLGSTDPLPKPKLPSVNYPVFRPPATLDPDFLCEYPEFPGWVPCSGRYDRSCWIKTRDGIRLDAATDYERTQKLSGKTRHYTINITNSDWNADGYLSHNMILVNGTYPGPPIEACWGDVIEVTVKNLLKHNGTAVHWHGIRQEESFPMDGVPGISQCPIAPGDTFTYKFQAKQYGTSWYHSHYGVQYANGLLGPLLIHGPTTADWETAIEPILVSDWFHESAYEVIYESGPNGAKSYPSILINGKGDLRKFNHTRDKVYPSLNAEPFLPPCMTFKPGTGRPQKYLLRIINTSFSTTFTFSIDNHWLIIISADFVPVLPNYRTHITVGIGQRYNVIVEARPVVYDIKDWLPTHFNFWMRVTVANCFNLAVVPPNSYNTMGILRYEGVPEHEPTSKPWPDLTNSCDDATGLVPKVPWTVGDAVNGWPYGEGFEAGFSTTLGDPSFPLARWSLEEAPNTDASSFKPLQVNYENPIFLDMDREGDWDIRQVVIPENYGKEDWIYLAFAQPGGKVPAARHPIHLHGHDFAIVQIESGKDFKAENIQIQKFNPMRRDVILLPEKGFIVIAFRADNPGSWILHCHIAFHASEGFAIQILENRATIKEKWYNADTPEKAEAERVCRNWRMWQADCHNHWPGLVGEEGHQCYPACPNDCPEETDHIFLDDSGI